MTSLATKLNWSEYPIKMTNLYTKKIFFIRTILVLRFILKLSKTRIAVKIIQFFKKDFGYQLESPIF